MSNGFDHQPMGLRAPRVPFDLRCVILAALGLLVTLGADSILGWFFDTGRHSPVLQCLTLAAGRLGGLGLWATGAELSTLTWWQVILTSVVFVAIWAYFGSAMIRASALRLTRDEPFTIGEAFAFGGRNWLAFLRAPLLVILFAAFFTLCNMGAGLAMSLHFVGSSLLAIVLFPLVLISSLLITFSVLGGLVTLPMIWAGIGIEQNGALDAVSRTFSYLFARPFRFFFGYALIFLLAGIILYVGDYFEGTVKDTLHLGIVRADLDDVVSREPEAMPVLEKEWEDSERVERERDGIRDLRNLADASWYDKLGFLWMWLLLNVFLFGFRGYAIYLVLGGTVSLYLQLRRDVDGADESEIYPPIEELEEQPEGETPRWVAGEEQGGARPGAPETGTPETGTPETGKPESGEPEGAEPESGEPESGEPDDGQPEAEGPEGGEPESEDAEEDGGEEPEKTSG